jgi:hypothetical protein
MNNLWNSKPRRIVLNSVDTEQSTRFTKDSTVSKTLSVSGFIIQLTRKII